MLITGANGFVGRVLINKCNARGAIRRIEANLDKRFVEVGDIDDHTDWHTALNGIETVVHLAARVHVMDETASDSLAAYCKVNVGGSLRLAESAVACGVRRLIYISSIKVNGETTRPGSPFRCDDRPAPADAYGMSKYRAELELHDFAAKSGLELVVVRPPLVYGPGVGANFRRLIIWLRRGIPLPFGLVANRRSMIGVDNLCDLILTCSTHHQATGRTFLASDGEDVSTSALLRRLATAMGKSARLLPVPEVLLRRTFDALGKSSISTRLLDSLQVDVTETKKRLGWEAPWSLDEGLCRLFEIESGRKLPPESNNDRCTPC